MYTKKHHIGSAILCKHVDTLPILSLPFSLSGGNNKIIIETVMIYDSHFMTLKVRQVGVKTAQYTKK